MNKSKIITPMVTIFNDDCTIDFEGNKLLLNYLFDNGVDGVVVLGSTGEFTAIDYKDKKDLIKYILDGFKEKGEILVGTGCSKVEETVKLSNFALENGADSVLIICQYYFGMSDEEIFHYYDYIAPKIKGDIYLYNFPDRTKTSFTPELVLKLCRNHKNIVGMKESVSSFAHTRDIMGEVKKEFPNFKMYSGFDDQFDDNVDFGGCGSIGAISNLLPDLWVRLVKAKNEGNYGEIKILKAKILSLMKLYQIETNCSSLFKHILKARGLDINTTTLFPFENIKDNSLDKALKLIDETLK